VLEETDREPFLNNGQRRWGPAALVLRAPVAGGLVPVRRQQVLVHPGLVLTEAWWRRTVVHQGRRAAELRRGLAELQLSCRPR
jgi:hypothetical protein